MAVRMAVRGGRPPLRCRRDASALILEERLGQGRRRYQMPESTVVLAAEMVKCPHGCFHFTFTADPRTREAALHALIDEAQRVLLEG